MRTHLWSFGVVYIARWGDQLGQTKGVRAVTEAVMVAWL